MKIARQNSRMLTKITASRKEQKTPTSTKNLDEISDPVARALFQQLPAPVNGGVSLSNIDAKGTKVIIATQHGVNDQGPLEK